MRSSLVAQRPLSSPPGGRPRSSIKRNSLASTEVGSGAPISRNRRNPVCSKRQSLVEISNAFPSVPPETIMELREVFRLADKDGGGSIGSEELKGLLDLVGLRVSRDEFNKLMAEIDEDGSGEVDVFEFITMMTRKVEMDATPEQLKRAFKVFADDDPSGTISMHNLKRVVTDFGPKHGLTEQQGEKLLKDLDAEMKALGAQFSMIQLDEDGQEERCLRYPEYVPLMLLANNPHEGSRRSVTAIAEDSDATAPSTVKRTSIPGRGGLKGRNRASLAHRGSYAPQ